jgi:H+-transporting ATPase
VSQNVPSPMADPPGLTAAEAGRRLAKAGPNSVSEAAPSPPQRFAAKLWGPIPWMLEAAIVLEIGLGSYVEAAVIASLLLLNALLGFVQEGRASAVLAALKARLAPTALVRRDGEWLRRPAAELVPGDVVRLPLGAIVPADARLVSGSVLVDQSMLTGESLPVDVVPNSQVFAGSLVRRGQGVAEVTATGSKTQSGRAAELVRLARAASTEQAAILGVTRNLAIINGAVAVLVVVYAHWAVALPAPALVRLALTALLATIPVALPATFTLSAALSAQALARRGVLLTRLSAAHEAAAMDVLCADKTGTLTRNALKVLDVRPMPGFPRERVLALAALASSEADQDPIDAAVRTAASETPDPSLTGRRLRFVPFDPTTKMSEAFALDGEERAFHVIKGAFEVVAEAAETSAGAARIVEDLAGQGQRVIAVATGRERALRLAGLIALSDPPRDDSAGLIDDLRHLGVRTLMVTGDAPATAAAIARKVGLAGAVATADRISDDPGLETFGVFARVVPEEKYRLVKALQARGHTVGMCGDGVNDAPALRQAQMGVAVSSATDVAKAAAGMVMTEPGLGGIVAAVREGRSGFQRLQTYALNMLVKKVEILLFLAVGLVLTGRAIMTPTMMVLMMMTNDLLSMSLTTDRPSFAQSPSVWRMGRITATAVVLGAGKMFFSVAVLAFGKYGLGLDGGSLQTIAFVGLIFGSQALIYVVRERRRLWSSTPSAWVLGASVADIAIVSTLALTGVLIAPVSWRVVTVVFAAAIGFAFILDQMKRLALKAFKIG